MQITFIVGKDDAKRVVEALGIFCDYVHDLYTKDFGDDMADSEKRAYDDIYDCVSAQYKCQTGEYAY